VSKRKAVSTQHNENSANFFFALKSTIVNQQSSIQCVPH
jgi:hypothetical protein